MPPQTSGRPLDARNQQGSAAPERSGGGPATLCSGGSGAPANPGGIARCARDEQQRDPPSSAADGARRTCAARRAGRLDTHLGAHGHVDDGCTPMRPEVEISLAENIGLLSNIRHYALGGGIQSSRRSGLARASIWVWPHRAEERSFETPRLNDCQGPPLKAAPGLRFLRFQRLPERPRAQPRDIGRCCPSWCDRAGAARHAGSRSSCRFVQPWSGASSACRRTWHPTQ